MSVVCVSGISMRPFLVTGDVLILETISEPLPFGSIVYVTKLNGEKSVHRYLGKNKIKGDRAKYWDEVKSIDFIVTERVIRNTHHSLKGIFQRWVLGGLSYCNLKVIYFVHHISAGLIEVFGRLARFGKW